MPCARLYTAPPVPLPTSFWVKMEKDMLLAQLLWKMAPPAWEALLVVKVEFMMLPVLVSPNVAPPFWPAVLLVKAVRRMLPAAHPLSERMPCTASYKQYCRMPHGSILHAEAGNIQLKDVHMLQDVIKRRACKDRQAEKVTRVHVLVDGAPIQRSVAHEGAGGNIPCRVCLRQEAINHFSARRL